MKWTLWVIVGVACLFATPVQAATENTGYINATKFQFAIFRYGFASSYDLSTGKVQTPADKEAFVIDWDFSYVGQTPVKGDPTLKYLLLDAQGNTYAPDATAATHQLNLLADPDQTATLWTPFHTRILTTVYIVPKGTVVSAIFSKDGRLYLPLNQHFDMGDYPDDPVPAA